MRCEMSYKNTTAFTKDNVDIYLKALAKEYRRIAGKKTPAEIILIGGASVLVNYGFRDLTTDIDAIIDAASCMRDAIITISDRYDLPIGWLNADFKKTTSYSHRLIQFSKYYRTYSNVLTIRTIDAEYLIAMKLMSGREYKRDRSDVVGILMEHERAGNYITKEQIIRAIEDLYDTTDGNKESSWKFLDDIYNNGNFEEIYNESISEEKNVSLMLSEFEEEYPGVVRRENIADIINELRRKRDNQDGSTDNVAENTEDSIVE